MFKFLFWLSGQVRKRLDKKAEVGLKIYDVTNWETITITNHILPDISRSKGNQTITFCHLIDYNEKYFSWKIMNKMWRRNWSQTLFKNSILSISLYHQCELYKNCFYCMPQVEDYQNILKLRCWPLAFSSYKAFLKHEKKFGTSFSASFSAWILRKDISHILLTKCLFSDCQFVTS